MSRAEPLQDPRIAKKEMIVTRFKSAQQKKQQQNERKPEKNSQMPLSVSKKPHKVYKSPHAGTKSPQTHTKPPQTIDKPQETVTKISQTVKSVPPKTKSPKKGIPKKSSSNSNDKRLEVKSPIMIEDDYPEYYPEKFKRAPGTRKVFLKPKQKSTMVAKTNKRKFNTPQRGIKSPQPDELAPSQTESISKGPVYSELSMAEVIRIVEENDSLDDEDLMEILTCPSPVWWEEPPDDMYIEEAICSRKPEEKATGKTKSPIRERCMNTLRNSVKYGDKIIMKTSNRDSSRNQKTIVKKDDKFMKKSKKLENVLGNIKNKVSKGNEAGINQEESGDTETSHPENDAKSSNDVSITSDSDKNVSKIDKDTDAEVTTEVIDTKIEIATIRKVKKLSESTEGSLGDFNQEMLLDLENMVIPVRDCVDLNSPDCVIINDDNSSKIIDVDDLDCKSNDNKDNEIIDKDDCNINTETKSNLNGSNNKGIEKESKEANAEITDVIGQAEVPQNMPPLIKCPKFENVVFASPNSYKSITDDVTESSSASGVDMMDTISDTNIKFITDDDVSDGDDKNKNNYEGLHDKTEHNDSKVESNVKDKANMSELNEMAVLTNIKDTKSKDSYITVYKIVSGDDAASKPKNIFKNIPEYSSYVENLIQSESKIDTSIDDSLDNEIPDLPIDAKGQLNSFFKKCKNANRKRKRVDVPEKIDDDNGTCDSPKKSITVAQDENVKYCMKCSSIFDTDDCSYCLKTQKDVAKSEPEKSVTCDKCDFVGESKNNVNIHLKEHVTEDEAKT